MGLRTLVQASVCLTVLLNGSRGDAAERQAAAAREAAEQPTWAAAVSLYEGGDAVAALAHLEATDGATLLRQGRDLIESWQTARSDDGRRHLRASAALAMELSLANLSAPPPGPAPYTDLGEASLRALGRASEGEAAAAFSATWRLAQLQLLLLSSDLSQIESRARRDDLRHLAPALQAEWYIARGIAYETAARFSLGSSRLQQTPFGTAAMPRHIWITQNRARAREQFEAAVAADGSHREAQLRLGRLMVELDKRDEARPYLERAATPRCRDIVCGLAWLFLGDWQVAAKSPDAARRAYVNASSVLDVRQSALLGLLSVTLQTRPAVALEMTRQFDADAMLGRVQAPDAWSRYLAGQPLGWPAVFQVLRQEARQ